MNIDKSVFRWDGYSDQPATLDKRIKGRLRWRSVGGALKKLSAIFLLPGSVCKTIFCDKKLSAFANEDGIGLCVNLERPFEDKKTLSGAEIYGIVKQLNLRRIAVRIPLVRYRESTGIRGIHSEFLRVQDSGRHLAGPKHN